MEKSNTSPALPVMPLPTIIVSGYLGAGKTSFINHLLASSQNHAQDHTQGHTQAHRQGQRITVLVNDFGTISIDESLIVNRDGDIVALANGCMCCQIGGDLYRTLDEVLKRRHLIDYLVIETSGVADPQKIADIARAEPEMSLAHILTVIDGLNFSTLVEDRLLGDTLIRQAVPADTLLVTKADLAQKDELDILREHLSALAPLAGIAGCAEEAFSRLFLAPKKQDIQQENTPAIHHGGISQLAAGSHKVPFDSWSVSTPKAVSREAFLSLIEDDCLAVYRCKGILQFEDGTQDGTQAIVNKAGKQIDIRPCQMKVTGCTVTFIGPTGNQDGKTGNPSGHRFSKMAIQQAWAGLV